ncbi:MAG: sulfurtransferase TusA family protein [Eubacteriales bacterium]|nr:sulfurtransferase TusA family protein [Eubacteriales bacterium]
MKVLNCIGDFCPIPLLYSKAEAQTLKPGESFMLVTDHSCVLESIQDYYLDRNYELKIAEVLNGVWEVTISRKC